MTHIACRLTAKNRDQLRNPALGSRVSATFTFYRFIVCTGGSAGRGGDAQEQRDRDGRAAEAARGVHGRRRVAVALGPRQVLQPVRGRRQPQRKLRRHRHRRPLGIATTSRPNYLSQKNKPGWTEICPRFSDVRRR